MFIIDYLRRRSLKRNCSKLGTGILPMKDIRTAIVFIDVEAPSFDACKNAILAFYRENGIKGEIIYFDFRKLDDAERLFTSITNTLLKKDINFYGKPSNEKLKLLLEYKPDLLISLINKDDFPIGFMARCIEARFKIGRRQFEGDTFDIVFTDTESGEGGTVSELGIFSSMTAFLKKIQ